MKEQLEFQLEKINREETKIKVEEALEKYRIMLLTQELNQLPKVTQNFSLELPAFSNQFHSSTETTAINNAEYEIERSKFIKRVSMAVNRLAYKERAILIRRYMTEDDIFDYQVYSDLHMSERTYHRHKSKAFYRLAFALNLVVYHEKQAVAEV
ncbi:ArpU family phage packaging/lysis transcriptional regulator [Cytobacillus oceanisediminis]|uniref:ArpU family phage packaging/lysis transcriptional regulator n=1 Tax=Cytobacillus oceanisediminis TaxID=665099 RepID=UPI001FB533E7|nr:ArpU family phage packaging/lysis transcriptional regulator [Cytobacillus oceanisediminis]UOE54928.1 ArpU family transcriptional regulator [Cytobacillus oceanisediminis]